jgi:hypothetical protein
VRIFGGEKSEWDGVMEVDAGMVDGRWKTEDAGIWLRGEGLGKRISSRMAEWK